MMILRSREVVPCLRPHKEAWAWIQTLIVWLQRPCFSSCSILALSSPLSRSGPQLFIHPITHTPATSLSVTISSAGKAVCPAEVVTWCTEIGEGCRGNESDLDSFVGFFFPGINCDPRVAFVNSILWLPKWPECRLCYLTLITHHPPGL